LKCWALYKSIHDTNQGITAVLFRVANIKAGNQKKYCEQKRTGNRITHLWKTYVDNGENKKEQFNQIKNPYICYMNICITCKKQFRHSDMMGKYHCDDCFDKMMEQEDRDFEIFHQQNGNCYQCNKQLSGWIVENGHAVCLRNCTDRLPPPIQLKIKKPG